MSIISVDFDGTVVKHRYPEVGEDVPGAVDVLKKISNGNHLLILNTMRSDQTLADAVQWFADKSIPLYGVNENPSQKQWTNSPKVFAHVYIDDAALGCPLVEEEEDGHYVNWYEVDHWLNKHGF